MPACFRITRLRHFPPRGPSAGHQRPSRPFGLQSLTQKHKNSSCCIFCNSSICAKVYAKVVSNLFQLLDPIPEELFAVHLEVHLVGAVQVAYQGISPGRPHHDQLAPNIVLYAVRRAAEVRPRRLELDGPAADQLQQTIFRGGLPLALDRILLARAEHERKRHQNQERDLLHMDFLFPSIYTILIKTLISELKRG